MSALLRDGPIIGADGVGGQRAGAAVVEFVDIHGKDAVADALRTTLADCVGPVAAQTAIALGVLPAIAPGEFTMSAVVAAIVRHLRSRGAPASS